MYVQEKKMSREEIYERLKVVFQDVFETEIALTDGTMAADVAGWDSLTHISLLSAVEDEFEIEFDMKAVQRMKNVGDMVNNIIELLA